MENNMKSCLNLQATPRGQQAETSQTSRLIPLLRRKGCRSDGARIIGENNRSMLVNNVIINSALSPESTHNQLGKSQIIEKSKSDNSMELTHPASQTRRNDVFRIVRNKNSQKNNNKSDIKLISLISIQLIACLALCTILTMLLDSCSAEPIPAGSSANNNAGGSRTATTKALRGPPINGSIFGKRSLMASSQSHHSKSASRRAPTDVANNQIEEYENVITDIIEDFLAKNADGEPEEASRAFCRMIVYECTQFLARSRRSAVSRRNLQTAPTGKAQSRFGINIMKK